MTTSWGLMLGKRVGSPLVYFTPSASYSSIRPQMETNGNQAAEALSPQTKRNKSHTRWRLHHLLRQCARCCGGGSHFPRSSMPCVMSARLHTLLLLLPALPCLAFLAKEKEEEQWAFPWLFPFSVTSLLFLLCSHSLGWGSQSRLIKGLVAGVPACRKVVTGVEQTRRRICPQGTKWKMLYKVDAVCVVVYVCVGLCVWCSAV